VFHCAVIRTTVEEDSEAIEALLDRAFQPSHYESRLRSVTLAQQGDFYEWVWELEGELVAYILFSPARHEGEAIGYHLAPVAVDPVYQGRGIGSQLIRAALEVPAIADSAIFVLGDPGYYERFGFEPTASALCPYDEGNAHFRALRWAECAEPFTVGYAEAFTLAGE